jgi:non-specific serine/threonine protein kinase
MKSEERPSLYRYRFGTAEFDEARFELTVGDLAVEIQRKPLEMLAVLLRHANEVVTRDELLETVWGGRPTVEHVVANALAKLRVALGDENAARIVTQTKVGYRLIGPVERIAVGRHFASALQLTIGCAVPRRDNFILQCAIGQTLGSEVWLAEHAKTGERRVYKFSTEGQRLAALKREATLSRVLRSGLGDRQDLVRVIDWNFHEPPFFLECEYAGPDLAAWSETDAHLRVLSSDERLNLFLQIADAVAAAHSVGVLHKDLKPTNILVSAKPDGWQLRVGDFGSGRLLEMDRLVSLGITRLGLTLTQGVGADSSSGTLLYLAPELLAGEGPTVQSDVYALGLMLYQMLIGDLRKPLVSGWERDIFDPDIRDDIAKATDGDPARRLSSAAELADRLRALEARRIERVRQRAADEVARETSEALQRSRARRPWIIAAFATLGLGLSISVMFFWRATVARRSAEEAAIQVAAINRFLNDDLLGGADPTAPGTVSNPTMAQMLGLATRRIDDQRELAPLTKAAIYATLGKTYAGLADYANAEAQLRRALALLPANSMPNQLRAQSEYDLTGVLLKLSKFQEARTLLDQADRDAGDSLNLPTLLAVQSHLTRGALDDHLNSEDEALVQFESADRLRQLVVPGDVTMLFNVRLGLINTYLTLRRFDKAREEAAPLLAPELTVDRVGVRNWAKVRELYAEILSNARDYAQAIQIDRDALGVVRERLGPKHFYVGFASSELANVYADSGQLAEALLLFRQACDIFTDAVGADSQDTMLARAAVGILESKLGQSVDGIADMKAARAALVKMFGVHDPDTEQVDYYLASSLNEIGQEAEAWSTVTALNVDSLSRSGENGDWQQRIDGLKGQILLRQGRKAEAVALLAPAVEKMDADHIPGWIVDPIRAALVGAGATNRNVPSPNSAAANLHAHEVGRSKH